MYILTRNPPYSGLVTLLRALPLFPSLKPTLRTTCTEGGFIFSMLSPPREYRDSNPVDTHLGPTKFS